MSIWSRDFTKTEKVLLLILAIILVALAYFKFVDQPVRESIAIAEADRQQAELELASVQGKIAEMENMRKELEENTGASYMASYNNHDAELAMLNDVLLDTREYLVTFSDVARSGNQIRREFTLVFRVDDYDDMGDVIAALSEGDYRCLVSDIRCQTEKGSVTVNATATFYETMVGGTPDAGLPKDSAATYQAE